MRRFDVFFFFFSSRRRHTRCSRDWSSDVCSSDLFLLRTATPPLGGATGKKVLRLRRVGKRICIGLEGDLWLVLHLMIAGRLHWRSRRVNGYPPRGPAALVSSAGSPLSTEAGSPKRAPLPRGSCHAAPSP